MKAFADLAEISSLLSTSLPIDMLSNKAYVAGLLEHGFSALKRLEDGLDPHVQCLALVVRRKFACQEPEELLQ